MDSILAPLGIKNIMSCNADGEHACEIDNHLKDSIDLVISVGGDGSLLKAAGAFQAQKTPPIVSFHMGTLAFLVPFSNYFKMKIIVPIVLQI